MVAGAFTENFRSALNGFNRTDVVQFIQRQTVEHEKAMRLLREENARLKQSATANTDSEQLRAELARLQQQVAEYEAQFRMAKEQNVALATQNRTLIAEKEALQNELAEKEAAPAPVVAPAAQAPVRALDRPMVAPGGMATTPAGFNEMELAAYRRAELAERMARERATAAAERMQSIYRQADEKLTMTANDMNGLLDALRVNYEQMAAMMEDTRNILAESSESIKASAELSGLV